MPSNPRRSNGALRDKLRLRLKNEGRPCWICVLAGRTGEIDYALPARHPYSFEVDELVPVSKYWLGGYPSPEAAALDYQNLGATHRCCNEWRSNRTVEEVKLAIERQRYGNGKKSGPRAPVKASRDWRCGANKEVDDA